MELKKIATMAEIHNMAIAPHNAAGTHRGGSVGACSSDDTQPA